MSLVNVGWTGRLLTSRRRSVRWLLLALPAEILLAFVILISPLHRFFLPLGFLGADFRIGGISLAGGNSVLDRR